MCQPPVPFGSFGAMPKGIIKPNAVAIKTIELFHTDIPTYDYQSKHRAVLLIKKPQQKFRLRLSLK
ncbi:hypothetical protein KL86DYS1_30809 [uncultured Dysgonomonas sp.]|uniref:Uncharacterized protein n=1 Tax=uncultured Dysgonomonas sp. TaxID=206096 RepID=A0A212JXY8_9BACT|nr:hypothetical protein KL86DYS1_30809 [uncultured Dysgonomonas sp.]